jgi:hypothetical protein
VAGELNVRYSYLVSYRSAARVVAEVSCTAESEAQAIKFAQAALRRLDGFDTVVILGPDGGLVDPSATLSVTQTGIVETAERPHETVLGADGMPLGEMALDGRPASAWPDPAEAAEWVNALARIAVQQSTERGVDKPTSVTNGYGSLWANYGRRRIQVAGADAEVRDEAELFELIDRWIAFELLDSEDALLDRDREYVAQWRARLPTEQAVWERAAERVFSDLDPSLVAGQDWRIVVEEDELDRPRRLIDDDYQASYSVHVRYPAGWQRSKPVRRRLLLPRLALKTATSGTNLFRGIRPEGASSIDDAVAYLAEWLQDEIIEDTSAAWPKCPDHEHPLTLAGPHSTTWTCPATDLAVAEVGHLLDGTPSSANCPTDPGS